MQPWIALERRIMCDCHKNILVLIWCTLIYSQSSSAFRLPIQWWTRGDVWTETTLESTSAHMLEEVSEKCSINVHKDLKLENLDSLIASTTFKVVGSCSVYWYKLINLEDRQEKMKHHNWQCVIMIYINETCFDHISAAVIVMKAVLLIYSRSGYNDQ